MLADSNSFKYSEGEKMKKIFLAIILPISSVFGCMNIQILDNYKDLVDEHIEWQKAHKHDAPDIQFWFRAGQIKAYEDIINILSANAHS